MSDQYNLYSQFSEIYDPYTSGPSFDYLFNRPSGMGPNYSSTSKRDIIGEITDPGTTTVYDSLPPPPKKFATIGAEKFDNGESNSGSSPVFNVYTIIIFVLVVLVWLLLLRTNKIIKVIKKLKKKGTGMITGSRESSHESDDDSDDDFIMY